MSLRVEDAIICKGCGKMHKEGKPVLSVIISVHNQSTMLEKCLKHLHEQSLQGIEYIIVDNGSDIEQKRSLVNILKEYEQVIYFPLSMHMRLYESYNVGIMLSKGKYVVFWNIYDEADINFLKEMAAYGKDDSVCVVATDVYSQPRNYDASTENVVLKKNLTDKPVALIIAVSQNKVPFQSMQYMRNYKQDHLV